VHALCTHLSHLESSGLEFRSDGESGPLLLSTELVLLVKVSVMLTVWLLITIFLHNDALTMYMAPPPVRQLYPPPPLRGRPTSLQQNANEKIEIRAFRVHLGKSVVKLYGGTDSHG